MTVDTSQGPSAAVLDGLRGIRDSLSVQRVFGEPYEFEGLAVIPVARISGGAGGGGGEGTSNTESGGGFGTGFGMRVHPIGVYQVRNGEVVWKPTVDTNRLAKGGQVLAGIVAVCVTLVLLRRR